jgi:hypothetical protein
VRHEDGSAARAGQLWITADADGGRVLVRKVRSSGLVVVPVTLDVEVADDETVVLDEAASPLGLPLAIYERLTISIPFAAIARRVIPIRDDVDLLALSSESVGVHRGLPIDGSTDPRLEIRQYLADRLTTLDTPVDEESFGDNVVFELPSIDTLFADLQAHLSFARGEEATVLLPTTVGSRIPAEWTGIAVVDELNVRVVAVDTPHGIAGTDDSKVAEEILALWGATAIVVCTLALSENVELWDAAGLRGSVSLATGERVSGPLIEMMSMPDAISKFLDQRIRIPEQTFGQPTRGTAIDTNAILVTKVAAAVSTVMVRGSKATTPSKKLGFNNVGSFEAALRELLPAAFGEDFSVQSIVDLADESSQ